MIEEREKKAWQPGRETSARQSLSEKIREEKAAEISSSIEEKILSRRRK